MVWSTTLGWLWWTDGVLSSTGVTGCPTTFKWTTAGNSASTWWVSGVVQGASKGVQESPMSAGQPSASATFLLAHLNAGISVWPSLNPSRNSACHPCQMPLFYNDSRMLDHTPECLVRGSNFGLSCWHTQVVVLLSNWTWMASHSGYYLPGTVALNRFHVKGEIYVYIYVYMWTHVDVHILTYLKHV